MADDTDPPSSDRPSIDELVSQMTLEEKVSLCSGVGNWYSAGVGRLGIPVMKMTDGPSGARGEGARSVNFGGQTSASFPCGAALGATWDPSLAAAVGSAIGQEACTKGAHLLLGPTVNLHRSPLAGRHFECFSEDPHLTGVLGSAFVRGVQSQGVGATAKHLVCNESEYQRHSLDCVVDSRTLHEVYLRPFQMMVQGAKPVAVMTAYNRINGVAASDHSEIIADIVRAEWGFDGLVVSDWGGTRSTILAAEAGLDLEMPGPAKRFGERLIEAVELGQVREAVVDSKVRRHLQALVRTGAWERPLVEEQSVDDPTHRRVARTAASASMVLLANPDQLLPLDPEKPQRLAVIGPNADRAVVQGGGSSQVMHHPSLSPFEAIREMVGDVADLIHEPGCRIDRRVPDLDLRLVRPPESPASAVGSVHVEYLRQATPTSPSPSSGPESRSRFLWPDRIGAVGQLDVRLSATFRPDTTGPWKLGLVVAGRARLLLDGEPLIDANSGMARGAEFFADSFDDNVTSVDLVADVDYSLVVEFAAMDSPGLSGFSIGALAPPLADIMGRAERAATEADAVVLVVGMDDDWETEGRDRERFGLPGQQDELIRRVTGANPRTIVVVNAGSPTDLAVVPASAALLQIWYPGEAGAEALTDVIFGQSPPGGRLPTTFPRHLGDTPSFANYPGEFGEVHYDEGLLVGHRWYDQHGIEPAFPFGFGLSTTTTDWTEIVTSGSAAGGDLAIAVTVRNTGERQGVDVIQVYAHFPESKVGRPDQQLTAFTKVILDPGQTSRVVVPIDTADLMYRNSAADIWELEPGTVELRVARHSRDVEAVIRVTT